MSSLPQTERRIRTTTAPNCFLCGRAGEVLYPGLTDRLYQAPGSWNLKRCPAPECQLLWLDPRPTAEDLGNAYLNYFTHGGTPDSFLHRLNRVVSRAYLRVRMGYRRGVGPVWYAGLLPVAYLHPGGPAEMRVQAMFLPRPRSGGRLLDVGCGNGEALARMRDLGWEVEGVDLDPKAVDAARARGLTVRRGQLSDQRYPNDHFDAVFMSHVIEHVIDARMLLRECYRVMSPGGLLVILTPNVLGWGHRHFKEDWRGLEPPRHLVLFSPMALRRAVVEAGFHSPTVKTIAASARYIMSASQELRGSRLSGTGARRRWVVRSRLVGVALQVWERVRLLGDPHAGDEVLIVARK